MYPLAYDQAAGVIKAGGLIAYPTETIWGLGCDPWNEQAVSRLSLLKKRPQEKSFLMIASDISQLKRLLLHLTPSLIERLQSSYQNQPTTWLIPDPDHWIPGYVKRGYQTIAVRISSHPFVKGLCESLNQPIISTSVNHHGKRPMNDPDIIKNELGESIDFIVPKQDPLDMLGKPSVLIDLLTLQQLR